MDAAALFKQLIWDNLVQAALAELFTLVPLLGWGPIGYVVTFFAIKFSDMLFRGVKITIDLELIVIANETLKKEYDAASVTLKIVAHSFGIDSKEFEVAREGNKKHLADFVRFNIARS